MMIDGEPLTDMDGRPLSHRFVTTLILSASAFVVAVFGFLIWFGTNG